MRTTKKQLSYGNYLQAIRLEKEITLSAVARKTNIKLEYLNAIEDEDREKLPDDIFVKGFLRAYAQLIGADPHEAVRRFCVVCCEADTTCEDTPRRFFPKLGLLLRSASIVFILSTVVVLSVYAMTAIQDRIEHHKGVTALKDQINGHENCIANSPKTLSPILIHPSKPFLTDSNPPRAIFHVEVLKKTALQIMIDHHQPECYHLNAGDTLEFETLANVNIKMKNFGDARLTLNGEVLKIKTCSDQAVNLLIPLSRS